MGTDKLIDDLIEITEEYKKEREKLPYNFNLLDEVYANENSHSRILKRLFEYNKDGVWLLFKSFLESLGEPFKNLEIKSPKITSENDRIDIRVRDSQYSLIIENKIHGASDQHRQIDRYIEIESDYGYKIDENIYVLYLTQSGGPPSPVSVSKDNKCKLNQRYKEINFKDNIKPWLTEYLDELTKQPISRKEKLLCSGLTQYSDFIAGMFYKRDGEQKMAEDMRKIIEEKLCINSNSIIDKIYSFNEFGKSIIKLNNDIIYYIKEEYLFKMLSDFEKELSSLNFQFIENIEKHNGSRFGEKHSGLQFFPKAWDGRFSIIIAFEERLGRMYIGIFFKDPEKEESHRISQQAKEIFMQNDEPSDLWPYAKIFVDLNLCFEDNDILHKLSDGTYINDIKQIIVDIYEKTKVIQELKKNP